MKVERLQIDTSQTWYVDLTQAARGFVQDFGDGLLTVFVPHATAGLALMEQGDGSEEDLGRLIAASSGPET